MGILIRSGSKSSTTKIGGIPTGVSEFDWPTCSECDGAMQFIAQIALSDSDDKTMNTRPDLLLIFMCQNDPGMRDEWDANAGANAALLIPRGSAQSAVPDTGETTLDSESFVALEAYDSTVAKDTDDDNYASASDGDSAVLGKLGGNALWIQGDETPDCDCGNSMEFVGMLEERGGGGINFGGGGVGYAFACTHCESKAKFLWQR